MMQNKKSFLSIVFLSVLGITILKAQTYLNVKEKNGTKTAYKVSDIRKITFSAGNIMVNKLADSQDKYALTEVSNMNFFSKPHIQLAEQINTEGKLSVFPNPADNILFIQGISSENPVSTIEIISYDGRLVFLQNLPDVTDVYQVSVSDLPQGIYLCRVKYGKNVEAIKFLKN